MSLKNPTPTYFYCFFTGLTSLITEIYGIRIIDSFFTQSSHSSAIVISSFLAGLATSTLFFSRFSDRPGRAKQIAIALGLSFWAYSFFALPEIGQINRFMNQFLGRFGDESLLVIQSLFFWIFLFVPAFLFGGAFPLSLAMVGSEDKAFPSKIYFFDTLGGISGALISGFILIPNLGLAKTIILTQVSIFLSLLFLLENKRARIICLLAMMLSIAHFIYAIKAGPHKSSRIEGFRFGDQILFQKESSYGTVTVAQRSIGPFHPPYKTLYIDYRNMCHTNADLSRSERQLGNFAMENVGSNAHILNIGLGCGITASEVAKSSKMAKLDIVEINSVVIEANKKFFQIENGGLATNPNVHIIENDGAMYIRQVENQKYDSIIIDIEEPSIVHSSALFTDEFIAEYKAKIKRNGLVAFWTFFSNPNYSKILVNTFQKNFNFVEYRVVGNAITLYASDSPLNIPESQGQMDRQRQAFIKQSLVSEINTLEYRALLKYFNINSVFSLPAHFSVEK